MTVRTRLSTIAIVVFALVTGRSAQAGGVSPDVEAHIKAANAKWAQAYARDDYEAIGHLYTDEGTLLPPGGDRVVGPEAIREFFAGAATRRGAQSVSFANCEFYGEESVVTEVSDTSIWDTKGVLLHRGKQILVFIKQGGTWKLHRDIWNASAPPR